MIFYSLRAKILVLVGCGMLLAIIGIVYMSHGGMERIIDRSQTVV